MKKSIVLVSFLIIGFIFYKVSFLNKEVIALRQRHEKNLKNHVLQKSLKLSKQEKISERCSAK